MTTFPMLIGGCIALAVACVWLPLAVPSTFVLLAIAMATVGAVVSPALRARFYGLVPRTRYFRDTILRKPDYLLHWALALFALWGLARVVLMFIEGSELTWSGFGHFAAFFVPFVLAFGVSEKISRNATTIMCVGLFGVSAMFAIVYCFGAMPGRIFSPYSVYVGNDAISLSILLAMFPAVCWVFAVMRWNAGQRQAACLWLIFALMISAVMFTSNMSRAGFIIFFAVLLLGAVAASRSKKQAVIGLLITLSLFAAAYGFSPKFQQRTALAIHEIQNAITVHDVSTSQGQRLALASVTLRIINDRPVVGYGLGTWRTQFSKRVPPQWMSIIGRHSTPHNEYLNISAQLGWVGGVLYGLICLALTVVGLDGMRRGHPPWVLACGLTLLIGSLSNVMIWDFRFWSPFIALTCLALAQRYTLLNDKNLR